MNKKTNDIEPETSITDVNNKMYQESKTPPYTIEIFEDVGRAFCIGILDYIDKNPVTRIPMSNFKSIENIKKDLISHNQILIPAKRNGEKNEEQKKTISRSNTF